MNASVPNYGFGSDDGSHDDSYFFGNNKRLDKVKKFQMKYCLPVEELKEDKHGNKIHDYTVYSTGHMTGSNIYHAQTREFLGHIGMHEQGLFKVSATTCIGQGSEPVHLYYYGPDEYERHHKSILPDSVRQIWMQKQMKNGYDVM